MVTTRNFHLWDLRDQSNRVKQSCIRKSVLHSVTWKARSVAKFTENIQGLSRFPAFYVRTVHLFGYFLLLPLTNFCKLLFQKKIFCQFPPKIFTNLPFSLFPCSISHLRLTHISDACMRWSATASELQAEHRGQHSVRSVRLRKQPNLSG